VADKESRQHFVRFRTFLKVQLIDFLWIQLIGPKNAIPSVESSGNSPMKNLTNRLLVMITFILVIGAMGFWARHFGSMEWIVENEIRMRQFVQQHPWKGWFLGLAIYTAFSLIPGTAGKSVVFGWVFGFWRAVLMVDIGLTIAAIAGFFAARFFVREMVQSRCRGLIEKLDRRLEKDGAFYLILMRLAHVPYSFVNYCAGATSVPLRTFGWTTAIGILPGTMIFVFVGTRIPTLAAISGTGEHGGIWQLLDPLLWGMLAATIVFPLLSRWALRKFRSETAGASVNDLSEFVSLSACSAEVSLEESTEAESTEAESTKGPIQGHADATR
jgi:uncharacterized membrane protein YdjX (TVP38/TMEM64 family)